MFADELCMSVRTVPSMIRRLIMNAVRLRQNGSEKKRRRISAIIFAPLNPAGLNGIGRPRAAKRPANGWMIYSKRSKVENPGLSGLNGLYLGGGTIIFLAAGERIFGDSYQSLGLPFGI